MTLIPGTRVKVLVVDDDEDVLNALVRVLERVGCEVFSAENVDGALRVLDESLVDVIITDLRMPGGSGVDLLRAVRLRDLDLPVILLTGQPEISSAAAAVELSAFRYLTKPFDKDELLRTVTAAARARAMARAQREINGRRKLEGALRRALDAIWIAFQPILSTKTKTIVGYEALLRSPEPELPTPTDVLAAAEKIGVLHLVGQKVRRLVAEAIPKADPKALFFVNLHIVDLADIDLYDKRAPLSQFADRIVLEITERASLEGVLSLQSRIDDLRALKYRVAVDDLGAGYAGLSYFASVQPEIIKIDLSLVRGVDTDRVRQQVIRSLSTLAANLGIEIVAEGIETAAELAAVIELGCTYVQGYYLARPSTSPSSFPPAVTWADEVTEKS